MTIFNSILHVVSEKKIFEISVNQRLLWPLAAILDNRSEQKVTTIDQNLVRKISVKHGSNPSSGSWEEVCFTNFQFHPPCSIGKEDLKKFQPIRGFYGPWQPCWIIDRNESNNTWLYHANEHSCHVWSHLLQWFSRRRLKCLRMDDGRQVMAIADWPFGSGELTK